MDSKTFWYMYTYMSSKPIQIRVYTQHYMHMYMKEYKYVPEAYGKHQRVKHAAECARWS